MIEFVSEIVNDTEVNTKTTLFRILVSFVFAALIGLEREYHKQPAGLRTHVLISIGATVIMLLSIYVPQTFQNFQNGDPGRIAAQVVSGIGFLGAGAIMRYGTNVKGLTTAASIWVVAAFGLAIGAGMIYTAVLGLVVVLFVLIVLDAFEKRLFTNKKLKTLIVEFKSKDVDVDPDELQSLLKEFNIVIKSLDVLKDIENDKIVLTMLVGAPTILDFNRVNDKINTFDNISKIELKQIL